MGQEVTHYVASLTGAEGTAVAKLVQRVRTLVPQVQESVSYSMPALLWQGKPLIAVVARKHFIAVYFFSGKVITALKKELAAFRITPGSVSLPARLIGKLNAARRAEIDADPPVPRKPLARKSARKPLKPVPRKSALTRTPRKNSRS